MPHQRRSSCPTLIWRLVALHAVLKRRWTEDRNIYAEPFCRLSGFLLLDVPTWRFFKGRAMAWTRFFKGLQGVIGKHFWFRNALK